ncbi:MAG TPA: heme ABC transporter ATP-binding protein [Thermomicrobiales bacterium]|nr:heme ABC transporter ATP-binding protein [Thermomicrobiales bacterium]
MTSSLRAEGVGVLIGGRWLLREADLSVSPGEVVALVGPNGAGKSTLLRALAGDVSLASGRVLIDDRPVESYRPHDLALRRAVLPQQTIVQFAFTVREIVEMGRGPRRGQHDEAVVAAALTKTETDHLADRPYPFLSGGEQARVTLARVLAQETPIVLLDEPTAALDLRHQQLVMRLARAIAAAGGIVVVVLHDLNLAASYANRIALLGDGRLIAEGAPWETLTGPLLSELFRCPITVTPHPVSGCPLVLPLATEPVMERNPDPQPHPVASAGIPGDNQQTDRRSTGSREHTGKDQEQDAERVDEGHPTGDGRGYALHHRRGTALERG